MTNKNVFLENGREIIAWDNDYLPIIYFHDSNTQSVLPHYHRAIEINCVIKGTVIFKCEHKIKEATSGQINIFNSNIVHSVIPDSSLTEEDKIVSVTVQINNNILKKFFDNYNCINFNIKSKNDEKTIFNIIYDFVKNFESITSNEELKIKSYLLEAKIIDFLYQHAIEKKYNIVENIENKQIRDILDYIQDNYQTPLKSEDIAKKFNLSRAYFSRFFRQYTSETFKHFIMDYRLNQSMKDLNTSLRIIDIAIQNGFTNENQYITWFKKKYNTTPSLYRKNKKR